MHRSRIAAPLFALLVIFCLLSACSQNNVTEDNSFKTYFDSAGVNGCFGLFDNIQGHFTIYNLRRYRDSAYLPASTFDIVNSLVGIQTGVVKDDSAIIHRGDLQTDPTPACNQTLTLRQAFRASCTQAFGELATRIGKDTLKKWIDSLGYGNKNISGPIDSFWLNDRLRITPDEELGLAKKLYFDQLPFFNRTQRIVSSMMLREDNANYQLSYTFGQGLATGGHPIAWLLGWIEENKHPYFFVLNLDAGDTRLRAAANPPTSSGACADLEPSSVALLKTILRQQGFFEGKK